MGNKTSSTGEAKTAEIGDLRSNVIDRNERALMMIQHQPIADAMASKVREAFLTRVKALGANERLLRELDLNETLVWVSRVRHFKYWVYNEEPASLDERAMMAQLKECYLNPSLWIKSQLTSGRLSEFVGTLSMEHHEQRARVVLSRHLWTGVRLEKSFSFEPIIPGLPGVWDVRNYTLGFPGLKFNRKKLSSTAQSLPMSLPTAFDTQITVLGDKSLDDTAFNYLHLFKTTGVLPVIAEGVPDTPVTSISEDGVCCPRNSIRGHLSRLMVYLLDAYRLYDLVDQWHDLTDEELISWVMMPVTDRELLTEILAFHLDRKVNPMIFLNAKQRGSYAKRVLSYARDNRKRGVTDVRERKPTKYVVLSIVDKREVTYLEASGSGTTNKVLSVARLQENPELMRAVEAFVDTRPPE